MRIVEILDVVCRECEGFGGFLIGRPDMLDVRSGRSGMPLPGRLRIPSPRCSFEDDVDITKGLLLLRWLDSLSWLSVIGHEVGEVSPFNGHL